MRRFSDREAGKRPDRRTALTREEYYRGRLENLAFVMGAFSIPSFFLLSVTGPFLFGSMAIVFAVLSKGGNLKFSPKGRRAAALGLAAILMAIAVLVYAFRTMQTMLSDPSSRERISGILYQKYGLTLDELMPALSGIPFLNRFFQ